MKDNEIQLKGSKKGVIRTPAKITIKLPNDLREWLDTKGDRQKSAYIREIIREDMEFEKAKYIKEIKND